MRVRFTSAAEAEVAAAVDWYAERAPRSVLGFLDEFESLVRRIAENAHQFPAVEAQIRRAGFKRFPYGLFFVVGATDVEVFACLHAGRDPIRWQDGI